MARCLPWLSRISVQYVYDGIRIQLRRLRSDDGRVGMVWWPGLSYSAHRPHPPRHLALETDKQVALSATRSLSQRPFSSMWLLPLDVLANAGLGNVLPE